MSVFQLGLLFLGVGVGFVSTINSMTEADTSLAAIDPVRQVTAAMATRFPKARDAIETVLEPALRHHVESFATLRRSSGDDDGGAGLATAEWMGGMSAFQTQKPLVLVLATNSAVQGADNAIARQFFNELRLLLAQDSPQTLAHAADAVTGHPRRQLSELDAPNPPLHCLDLRESYSQGLNTRQVHKLLEGHFAQSAPVVAQQFARTAMDTLATLLPSGLIGTQSACSSLHASVERGAVLVRGAQAFPRGAAEAFHHYADDVAAPVKRALLAFEVDTASQPTHLAPAEGVRRALEDSWSRGPEADAVVSRDEVLRPLLSRILRNVIDLSAL